MRNVRLDKEEQVVYVEVRVGRKRVLHGGVAINEHPKIFVLGTEPFFPRIFNRPIIFGPLNYFGRPSMCGFRHWEQEMESVIYSHVFT